MTTRPIIFADLDDTLFQSARKVPSDQQKDLLFVSEAASGNHSFMTLKQQSLFAWLNECADLIPVTARSTRSFANTKLPWKSQWSVLGNGAVVTRPPTILAEKLSADAWEVDAHWRETLFAEAATFADEIWRLERSCIDTAAELGITVRCPQSIENGLRHSVIVKQDNPDEAIRLREILDRVVVQDGWTSHLNGNNLAFTIPCVSKKRAVEYVLSQLPNTGERIIFGMGDSLTDMPFMSICDFFATPTRGQIAETYSFKK